MEYPRLIVRAGAHRRRSTPVTVTVPSAALIGGSDGANLSLWDEADGRVLPHQVWKRAGDAWDLAFVIDDLPAGATRAYALRESEWPSSSLVEGVWLSDAGDRIDIDVGGSRFASYNYGSTVVRPYLYPVYAAPKAGVTRNWPMRTGTPGETSDHPHHKGIYTAQGEVNGVDNWSEVEGHGHQVHTSFSRLYSGPVAGGFSESLDWTDRNRSVVMTETRRIVFYQTEAGLRVFDWEVLLNASAGAVTLGDTKEAGLLSIRVATSMDAARPDGGRILNGYGAVGEAECWGKRAPWCDYSGPLGSSWYGVCFMDHPSNPRHPTHWHVRDYGLMTANCFGVHHFTGKDADRQDLLIAAGESRRWRYRAVVHAGAGTWEALSGLFHDFAHPPAVEVK